MSDTHPSRLPSEPPKATALEIDYNNLKISSLTEIYPRTSEHERRGIRESIQKDGIWATHKMVIWREPGKQEYEIIAGRTRYELAKELGRALTSADFHTKNFTSVDQAEEWILKEGNRRNLSAEQKDALVATLIAKHPDWGSRKLAELSGVSHMTISRAKKKLKQKSEDAKKEDDKKDDAYDKLLSAWDGAPYEAQEKFVRENKIDLADLLRSL